MSRTLRTTLVVAALAAATLPLAACELDDKATTSDMCAYTQNDGQAGRDAKVDKIYFPDQKIEVEDHHNVYYFPCNARNYRFVPGSTDVNAKNEPVSSISAITKTGNRVNVEVTMDWTLNQTPELLEKTTIPLMRKYQAASTDPNMRNANFSTPGWSTGFLGENLNPTFSTAVIKVVRANDDSSWKDPASWPKLATEISSTFMTDFKANTGSTSDLLCASGESSGWTDPANPGVGAFNCGSVRITVQNIQPADGSLLGIEARKAKAEAEKQANKDELEAAKARYGDAAPGVLGDLDRIKACGEAKAVCYFVQSNGVNNPVPPAK